MFNIGITLFTALLLSSVAAYFSVVGLMAVFASAAIPIAIMGGTLELAKVVTASWVYRNWQTAPSIIRTYLTISVVVLSLITSLGIFGYLSKAHLDQAIPSGDIAAKLSLIDEKIKVEKDNIDVNRKAVKQMDDSVDQVMGRSTDEKGADKAASLRKAQQKERYRLLNEIETYNKRVAALNEERAPIATEIRKVEAEVGPIKYIAALIYDTQSTDTLEKAVRWVIIALVFVFDPLAILLLIAANISLKQRNPESRETGGGLNIPLPDDDITTLFDTPRSFQTPEPGIINIPKEFPDVLNSQYSYPQPQEEKVVTETPKPKETWSEILYRRAGLTKK
jgi:hypothetical protein